jgi:hypothetical protein
VASRIADSSGGLQIELLGPVAAWLDGRPVALGGQRPRALFAVLAPLPGSRRSSSSPHARATAHTHGDAAARDGGTLSFEDAIAYALHEPRA